MSRLTELRQKYDEVLELDPLPIVFLGSGQPERSRFSSWTNVTSEGLGIESFLPRIEYQQDRAAYNLSVWMRTTL